MAITKAAVFLVEIKYFEILRTLIKYVFSNLPFSFFKSVAIEIYFETQ